MAPPSTGTCSPWAEVADLASPCADLDDELLAEGLQLASDVLFDLTRRRWPGLCEAAVRPCGIRSTARWGVAGAGWCGCTSGRACCCKRLSEVRLPGYAVAEVTEVTIDGVVLDDALYRVDDHRWLVYLPESAEAERQGWPCCQRLDLPTTEVDTWAVEYTHGTAPPTGGRRSAMSLGCQLATAWTPAVAGECALPKRVTSVARQGTTMTTVDPAALVDKGLTGLADVDLWVAAVNRGAAMRNATVWSPNGPGGGHLHRRVGT